MVARSDGSHLRPRAGGGASTGAFDSMSRRSSGTAHATARSDGRSWSRRSAENVHERRRSGEIPMGLLFLDESGVDMHAAAKTVKRPLSQVPYEELCPGSAALRKLQDAYR